MADTIDLITLSSSGDVVFLVMTELGPWDGSTERLLRIQERFNHYLSFALDGELSRRFPELADKKVHVRVDCDNEPDPVSNAFLDKVRDIGERNGVSVSVEVLRPGKV